MARSPRPILLLPASFAMLLSVGLWAWSAGIDRTVVQTSWNLTDYPIAWPEDGTALSAGGGDCNTRMDAARSDRRRGRRARRHGIR